MPPRERSILRLIVCACRKKNLIRRFEYPLCNKETSPNFLFNTLLCEPIWHSLHWVSTIEKQVAVSICLSVRAPFDVVPVAKNSHSIMCVGPQYMMLFGINRIKMPLLNNLQYIEKNAWPGGRPILQCVNGWWRSCWHLKLLGPKSAGIQLYWLKLAATFVLTHKLG